MVELFTNGALLTDEIVKVLKKYPPILVDVSIYGASETTYKKITKCHNMFEKVIENCKKMIKNNIRVALRTPVLTYTLDEIEEMRRLQMILVLYSALVLKYLLLSIEIQKHSNIK